MRQPWLLVVGMAILASPVIAHQSFGDVYLESDTIEVEGRIVEFQYKNPHSWIHVAGHEGPFSEEKIYAAEWVSTSQLERDGITKNTLKPGDNVRIWGSPAKRLSEPRMHLKRIERSDGWQWRGRQGVQR